MLGDVALIRAVRALHDGALIAYPTEAVWGIGCDPFNRAAVETLLALKRRPVHKGLILAAADATMLAPLLDPLPADQRQRLADSWPGPNTWVVPDPKQYMPSWIRGTHDSVALRVSAHPLIVQLSRAFGGPIVSTSANPAGLLPARNRYQVRRYFDGLVMILPGETAGQRSPTVICDIVSGRVLRTS